jgi:hypothetical protein
MYCGKRDREIAQIEPVAVVGVTDWSITFQYTNRKRVG